MKTLATLCAISCFLAVFNLPISYYTFLRILVSMSAIAMIYNFNLLKHKNYGWIVVFITIFFLFNPIFPIHFYRKAIWIPLDILTGILFLVYAFFKKKEIISKMKKVASISIKKPYTRDRIIISKNTTLKDN